LLWERTESYLVVSESNGRISLIDRKAKNTLTDVSKPSVVAVLNTAIKLHDGYVKAAGSALWVIDINEKTQLVTAMVHDRKEINILKQYNKNKIMHRKASFLLVLIFVSFIAIVFSQNTVTANKTLVDTIGKAKQNINMHNITIFKTPALAWSKMSVFQKAMVFIKMFFNKYGIIAWL
jgi:hypothetical protein